jgi:hypothetical protein
MDATKCGANAEALFDESDAAVEIAAAKKNVVEQGGHLIRCPGKFRRGKRATGEREKNSARNECQHWRSVKD